MNIQRIVTRNSCTHLGYGMICMPESALVLAMRQINHPELVIRQYCAQPVLNQVLICHQVGRTIRTSNLFQTFLWKYNNQFIGLQGEIVPCLVTNGNFKADHVKQKNPEDDVALTVNGEAYMTGDAQYKKHLSVAVEEKQKSTNCVNHCASAAANNCRKEHLDCTGLASCTRGRHRCFVPDSMADFQKGER